MTAVAADVEVVDLAATSLRELNQRLHDADGGRWQILHDHTSADPE